MDLTNITPLEVASEACGFEDDSESPRSNIYVYLSKIDTKNRTEKPVYEFDAKDAYVDFDFDETSMSIYLIFKSKADSTMKMITRAFFEYEKMLLEYVSGKEIPDFSIYIMPKKYKSNVVIKANLPIDFHIVSEGLEEFPDTLMFKYEYDTTGIQIIDADESKWDDEVRAEEELAAQRENEIERQNEARRKIEEERQQRLQNFLRRE